jgi:hypothetical protein
MKLTTVTHAVDATASEYGERDKRAYLYIENQGDEILYFGFGDTEPTGFHKLDATKSFEWAVAAPQGKIWMKAAATSVNVVFTE